MDNGQLAGCTILFRTKYYIERFGFNVEEHNMYKTYIVSK